MGKTTGFMEFNRLQEGSEPPARRIKHYREFLVHLSDAEASQQGARCMDCGIPFCMNGCPINNRIPDWNDLVYQQDWQRALATLHSTNNFPEFTGRICPAPCEAACTLNINNDAVGIKSIEHAIIDKGWDNGWVQPQLATHKTGKKVAIVGSGPAGLSAAQQLARAGHHVEVFEKNDRIGGLLRYGIPDFKLEKQHIDRRIAQMQMEGVVFHTNQHIGVTIPAQHLSDTFDAVVLSGGCEQPRDLAIPGRALNGVEFAMNFLPLQNKAVAGDVLPEQLTAEGKHVVVIGGGDTGADCVGTSNRQGALSVTQLELMPKPPKHENKLMSWPYWPAKLRSSTSHEEGCDRDWAVTTKAFIGDEYGKVCSVKCARVEWVKNDNGQMMMQEVPDSEFEIAADLVLFAMGFVAPTPTGLLEQLEVAKDARGNVLANTDDYRTSQDKVFVAGDMRRGQSLVVWAIREGRQCAHAVDAFLMGSSVLPR